MSAGEVATAPVTVEEFAGANLSRATGAGLDPHEYQRVTGGLTTVASWNETFVRVARQYLARAEHAVSPRSAGEHYQMAARWFHVSTLAPPADTPAASAAGHALAAAAADTAMGRALALLEPRARRIVGAGFAGWLRGPVDAPITVIVVPGLDSSKEEFHDVTSALLLRGAAVFTMDGPGQGVLAATSTIRPDYHEVVRSVVDVLDVDRVGLIGLSLGGYYVAESAAHEPRISVAATVSGPSRLDWDALPPVVRNLLVRRAGGEVPARDFARHVDLSTLVTRIAVPILVVDGGQDVIPGVTNGERLARLAPHGEYLLIPHGDHLLGNARPDWLSRTADWLTGETA